MRYRHMVFDLDGTLVDSLTDIANAANHVLTQLGLAPLSIDVVRSYIGDGARVLLQRALGERYQSRVDEALALFLPRYTQHLLDHTRTYDGIPEALAELSMAGVVLTVLTNKPEGMARAILQGLDLAGYFTIVVGGDSLPQKKPDPAGLHHIRKLSGAAPATMLLVGDTPVDLVTARAAQVAFCGVGWGFAPAALEASGDSALIEAPAALLQFLK